MFSACNVLMQYHLDIHLKDHLLLVLAKTNVFIKLMALCSDHIAPHSNFVYLNRTAPFFYGIDQVFTQVLVPEILSDNQTGNFNKKWRFDS